MIIGYIAIFLMGSTLGLLGAGGSILTVPILVYLFKINPILSTSYSLLLVGFTALIGCYLYYKKNQIDSQIAIKFAIPSIIAVYLTRRYLLPKITNEIVFLNFAISKDLLILILFALVMFLTAIFMIKKPTINNSNQNRKINKIAKNFLIILEASFVGFITAIIGAGGGFLIVPALTLLNKINIKTAIGTSLLIIAAKSLIGFVGDIQAGVKINYFFALTLIIISSISMCCGIFLSKYFNSNSLKKGFGYFVMLTSIFILIKEIIL